MINYTDTDIQHGAGAFEQAMRTQTTIPGRAARRTPGACVGLLSAAMRSGLPASLIDKMIDTHFSDSALTMKRILTMCEGNDWSVTLWHLQQNGLYKLCTDLCRPGMSQWRYDRFAFDD